MGGQPAVGELLRPRLRHWPAHVYFRSSFARRAVHIIDADIVGFGWVTPDARLAVLQRLLRLFLDAKLKEQLVVVAGGWRPPFKRERGAPRHDGSAARTWHALFACLKTLEDHDVQVIRSDSECDWRIVQLQRAMERRGCPAIVYSRDWDFALHMCPYIASLVSMDGELTVQTLNLMEAAHGLGLGDLGLVSFPILGAIIPGSDWGTAFRGVGKAAALEIVKCLQQLAHRPESSGTQPLPLTPELICETALDQERVQIHESQADAAAAVHTLAQLLVIFAMVPAVKADLDFTENKVHIALEFSLGPRIGSLCLDNSICVEVISSMQQQLAREFASVTPAQYLSFLHGEVDPDGRQLLECGPPQGDAASPLEFELETLARAPPCVICGATESSSGKWLPDFMDWATSNCKRCYMRIYYRLSTGACTTVAAAVESYERDLARRCALEALDWTAGQPCSLCDGATTSRLILPDEMAEYCANVGLDVGLLCDRCWLAIKKWGSVARDAAQEENKKLAAGAQPLDLEALMVEYSCMKVGRLTMQRDQRHAASIQEGAAGASTVS